MSHTVARQPSLWRLGAMITVALIATMGISVATAPSAAAAPSPNASFAWTAAALTTDAGTPGVPDVGDVVTYHYEVTTLADAPSDLESFTIMGLGYGVHESGLAIAPGTSQAFSLDVTVTALMRDQLGGGPYLLGAMVSHKVTSQYLPRMATMAAPPMLYTAPTPITVATDFEMTEINGFEPGKLVEGDQVHYVTTVTNTSAVDLVIDGTGFTSPVLPYVLAAGTSVDLLGASVDVTYAHMAAPGVSFSDASVDWRVQTGLLNGTVPAPVGTAPTEPINSSFDASVTYSVNTAGGTAVPLGGAAAGDVIDFVVNATHTGNVTLNYVGITLDGSWGAAADAWSQDASAFLPGTTLPNGTVKAKHLKSTGNGIFAPYTLTPADVTRGYVDLTANVQAAPSRALFDADSAPFTQVITTRVFLKDFNAKASVDFTKATLHDTNGDGIGQEGETVTYRVRFKNKADQDLLINAATDKAGSDISTPVGAKFDGRTVAVGDTLAKKWDYTITAGDVARGTIDVGVTVDYTGQADWQNKTRQGWSPTITTGVYVAPPTTLDTSATYLDSNGDLSPSIGETVTVTVAVANTGTYPLTGLSVADAAGSDVTGLLPAFSGTIAAGTGEVHTFTWVLTAADFARGSLAYSTEMTADGLATTASSTSVNLTDITFQAYETDLDSRAAGNISVCLPDLTPTDIVVIGSTVNVTPGGSCVFGGAPAGHRVVGFSTPMVMGTDTFTVVVPGALGVGAHRLALYGADGELIGWKAVTVKDPIAFSARGGLARGAGGFLADTGLSSHQSMVFAGSAAALILLGTASMVVGVRRQRFTL